MLDKTSDVLMAAERTEEVAKGAAKTPADFLPEAQRRLAATKQRLGVSDEIVNMAVSRQQALKRLEGMSAQVEIHLEKLAAEPGSQAATHWRGEIAGWLNQMEELTPHVGKNTGEEWTARIVEWRQRSGK